MLGILCLELICTPDRQRFKTPRLASVVEAISMYRRKEQAVHIDTLCDRDNRTRYHPESFQALEFDRINFGK